MKNNNTYTIKKLLRILPMLVMTAFLFNCDDQVKEVITEEKQINSSKSAGDIIAPVPGSGGIIIPFNIKSTDLRIRWKKASDNITIEEDLHYKIYFSKNPDIATYGNMLSNGEAYLDGWIEDISNVNIRGLDPNTQYYFNVAVIDRTGNAAAYTMAGATTTP